MLHPEKKPKSWVTPPKKKDKGRGRDRERSKGTDRERSKTRSGDRRVEKPKDRRPQSPYQPREKVDRVTKKDRRNERDSEDDSEQDEKELERLLEKSEKLKERLDRRKGSANTRRVRSDIFEEGRREGEFMDLQRERMDQGRKFKRSKRKRK